MTTARLLTRCTGMETVIQQYGRHLVCLVFAWNLAATSGFILHELARPYVFKEYHVTAPAAALLQIVTNFPLTLAPLIGFATDLFPVCGYKKAPYIVVAQVLGIGALLVLGLVDHRRLRTSEVAACFFLLTLQVTMVNTLVGACQTRALLLNPTSAQLLLNFGATVNKVAQLGSSVAAGALISRSTSLPCLLAALPYGALLVLVCCGYLQEEPVSRDAARAARAEIVRAQRPLCAFAALVLACTVAAACCSAVLRAPLANVLVHGGLVLAVLGASLRVKVADGVAAGRSAAIPRCFAFLLASSATTLFPDQAMFYFWTDTPAQFRGGPNLPELYYNSVTKSVGMLGSLAGICFYSRCLSRWRYHHVFFLCCGLLTCVRAAQLLACARPWSRAPYYAWVLATEVSFNFVDVWSGLAVSRLLADVCPRDHETILLALFGACSNLGGILAGSVTGFVLDAFNTDPAGRPNEAAEFENLWKAMALVVVVGVLRLPVVALLPKSRQGEASKMQEVSQSE